MVPGVYLDSGIAKVHAVHLSHKGAPMSPTRSVIITGATTGLGREVAKIIAQDPSTMVVVACRDAELGTLAVEQLETAGGKAMVLPLDLGDQASVRRFVELFRKASLPQLFGIICNAGMQNVAPPKKTIEGYETTFAVNHLGHYCLVRLLLDDLSQDGRITFVSSGTHDPKEKTGMPEPHYENATAAAHDFEPGRTAGLRRYTTSKLCNIYNAYELSHRLSASDDARLSSIKVNAIDPGLMPATGLARSWPAPLRWVSRNILPLLKFVNNNVHTPATSAKRVAALSLGPDAQPGGRYFSNGKPVPSSDASYEKDKARELWISSATMISLPVNI